MRVYKDTPFELSFMPWELEPPKTMLMVVVKATFNLANGGACTIADEQVPCLGEVPWDDGEPPSLRTETDYAVLKTRGEWYLTGRAFSASPVTVLPIGVRVGELRKQLAVWGDRVWVRGMLGSKPAEPAPFTEMPLRWERSFGGPGVADNPLGCGTRPVEIDKRVVEPLPNIEDPARPLTSKDDRPRPVGMFAIPGTWKPRVTKTGTYDDIWKVSRWPFFPRDFDYAFFNCAPHDQQLREGYWRGDEAIELTGLHRDHSRIRTSLPSLRARFFIEWATPRPAGSRPLELLSRSELEALGTPRLHEVPLRLDTIVIDSDAGHVMCSWRGLVEVADKQLSNVARVFAVHEPLDADAPHQHYEAWLLRKLLEEADEFGDEPEEAEENRAILAASGDSPGLSEAQAAAAHVEAELVKFLGAIGAILPPEPEPDLDAVRKTYREAGLDPDELLPEPEPSEVPEIPDPPSYLRLAALLRKRLGKPFTELDLSDAPYQKLDLCEVDFTGSILTGASFVGAKLRMAKLDGATLARADLSGADARGASLRDADVSELRAVEARFEDAVLDRATGSDADFTGARFARASFEGADLEAGKFGRCELRDARLDGADFTGSAMDGADFTAASLVDTSLEGVHAHDAIFERAKMPDLRGSDGADFTRARFVLVDAPRAQLQGAVLAHANLSGSNLEEADLSDSRAEGVNLMRCVLRRAKLDRADLREAVFLQADLFEASMEEADLSKADARGAHLFSAHLWRARTRSTLLEGAVVERTVLGDASGKRS